MCATLNGGLGEKGGRKSEMDHSDAQIVLTVYSHLSRLFVSSYASFFTSFAAFIAFVYAVLLPLPASDMAEAIMLTLLDLVILGSAFVFYLRARAFSKAMQRIESDYLVLSSCKNVHNWIVQDLCPKKTILDKVTYILFERPEKLYAPSEKIAILVLFLFATSTVWWIWVRSLWGVPESLLTEKISFACALRCCVTHLDGCCGFS